MGRRLLDCVHCDDRERVARAYDRARFNEEAGPGDPVFEIEYRLLRPDGEVRYILERTEATRIEDGRVVELVGTMQDITARKRIEEELEKAHIYIEMLHNRIKEQNNVLQSLEDRLSKLEAGK